MSQTNRVHGLKTDSKAYQLVCNAMTLATNKSMNEAKEYLVQIFKQEKLKNWEMRAIADCFTNLCNDVNNFIFNK